MPTFLEQIQETRREAVAASEGHRQAAQKFQDELQATKFKVYEVAGNSFARPANRLYSFEPQPDVMLGESRDIMLILDVVIERGTEVFTAFSMTDGMLWQFSLPAVTSFESRPEILSEMLKFVAQVQSLEAQVLWLS